MDLQPLIVNNELEYRTNNASGFELEYQFQTSSIIISNKKNEIILETESFQPCGVDLLPKVHGWVLANYIIAWSAGEHPRGASIHGFRLHCFDFSSGKKLWSKDWDIVKAIAIKDRSLFVVKKLIDRQSNVLKPHIGEVVEVELSNGEIVRTTPILLSEKRVSKLKHKARSSYLNCLNCLFIWEDDKLMVAHSNHSFEALCIG